MSVEEQEAKCAARRQPSYHLGFTTLDAEIDVPELKVTGQLPEWLRGTVIRNGPGRFELEKQSYRHWFDGLAMLHRFTMDGSSNSVSYSNRYLRGEDYRRSTASGKISFRTFASDPCRSLFQRVVQMFFPEMTDNASVNLAQLADRYVAMTEMPLPVEFDVNSLETRGVLPFGDQLNASTSTAHPHYDAATGAWINHGLRFGRLSQYLVSEVVPHNGSGEKLPARRVIAEIPVEEPGYLHSFGLSENYAILVESPLLVSPLSLLLVDRPFIENFEWRPERGTRFIVIDRRDGSHRVFKTDAFFVFHHVNAVDCGDELTVDLCAYSDASVIDALYLEPLRAGKHVPSARLTRFTIDLSAGEEVALAGGAVSRRELSPAAIELPRYNEVRCARRGYRYVYGTGEALTEDGKPVPGEFLNQLVKMDVTTGEVKTWRQPRQFPGEGIFIPAPGAESDGGGLAEDDGVVISVVLDASAERSFLLVLDGRSFTEIARAEVPQAIPFGFHGQFFGAACMAPRRDQKVSVDD